MRHLLKIASAAALATVMLGSAHASVYTFNFQGNDNSNTFGTLGNSRTATASNGTSSLSVRATAWNFSGGTTNASYLGNYAAGLGNKDNAADEHLVDSFGATDFILLQFSTPVTLTSAIFNAFSSPNFNQKSDSDANIRVGTGGMNWTTNPFSDGASQASVLAMFPTMFTSYVTSNSSSPRPLNTGSLRSTSWIIEAGGADSLIDGFKIGQVTASAVPEPATWALMILGFGAAGVALRSRRAKAARVHYAF
ncbi:PEPxxWA-CTERM sorting domain-containing protein [Sphingobium sp. DEHP117]|uniref:PEPxxWA-CTERM sorting domain-containing protein n=1 Tax=Sphingobium sp. DEHP117 TaxID=2993436 RepID=UPI0027D53DCC|nr:PEPxxWA-CTERM sorting domain-containing protein [Sphingobium sp. DEHP117]MDQ4420945.1 PEPxxWA-CTERM sorting domain-containing protein [Sphingobium sp. DEHP117]